MQTVHLQGTLTIATRGSPLALAQARMTQALLADAMGVPEAERDARFPLLVLKTTGDRVRDRPLADVGGKGLFTKELEEALLRGDADLAVHSLKDLPTKLPAGLYLAAVLKREDPRDVLIAKGLTRLSQLKQGAKLGTASVRRAAQALSQRPDLVITPLRGNVETRLAKIAGGDADATFLAAAGLRRLGMESLAADPLSPDEMLPAATQGIVGLEAREGDARTAEALALIDHAPSAVVGEAERGVIDALDGSCRTPVAALAELAGTRQLRLRAQALTHDGGRAWRRDETITLGADPRAEARALGERFGREIRAEAGPALEWLGT